MRIDSQFETTGEIANDRDLLLALGIKDAMASALIEKSRQALINQLGAAKDKKAPADYFKASEMLILITYALQNSSAFKGELKAKVREYIERSRSISNAPAGEQQSLSLVSETLSDSQDIDLGAARGVIFLLPEFMALQVAQPAVVPMLRAVAADAKNRQNEIWRLVLSSSSHQAGVAFEALGQSSTDPKAACAHDEKVDHYMASVFVVTHDDQCKSYVVTAEGNLVSSPAYRGSMMLNLLKQMLGDGKAAKLFDEPKVEFQDRVGNQR